MKTVKIKIIIPIILIICLLNCLSQTNIIIQDTKKANEYFEKAVTFKEQGDKEKALEYYKSAFLHNNKNGFYAARVGQHLYIELRDYEQALTYYRIALDLGFQKEWSQKQSIRVMFMNAMILLGQDNFDPAIELFDQAINQFNNSDQWKEEYSYVYSYKSLIQKLIYIQAHSKQYTPLVEHKIVPVILHNITLNNHHIQIVDSLTKQEEYWIEISLKCLQHFIKALSNGKMEIDYQKVDWYNPVSTIELINQKTWNIDTEQLSLEIEPILSPLYSQADSFFIFWPSMEYQSAHGGAGKFVTTEKNYWRGKVTIPTLRMIINGPELLLHEFFHTIENMAGIKPRHGFYTENREQFPNFRGETEIDFYTWAFDSLIPELIDNKWNSLSF